MIASDGAVHRALRGLLASTGISYLEACDGSSGVRAFYRERPNVVVIDTDLPVKEGWEALSTVRDLSDVPVLILSSLGNEMEQVKALRSGADGYLCKPFGKQEVLARVEALLRRSNFASDGPPSLLVDDFLTVDRLQYKVQALGTEVKLTPTEFRMLCALMSHPDRVLTHGQLLEMVWNHGYRDRDEVKLYISYLRRKLRKAAAIDPVETVRGVGYRYRPRHLSRTER